MHNLDCKRSLSKAASERPVDKNRTSLAGDHRCGSSKSPTVMSLSGACRWARRSCESWKGKVGLRIRQTDGTIHRCPSEICPSEVGLVETGPLKVGPTEIGLPKFAGSEIRLN